MVLSFDNKGCSLKRQEFSLGSLVCDTETCILCRDETWGSMVDWRSSLRGIEIHAIPGKALTGVRADRSYR